MTPLAALLLCVGAIHAAALLADRLFRGRRSYSSFLHSSGLDPPRPMQLRWSTHRLNRTFTRLGAWRPRLVRAWFSVGAVATLLLVFPSMVLLVRTLLNAILPAPASAEGDSERNTDRIVLQPVLPGVNLPLGDLGYYFVTLLVCSVVHEAGHAAAAAAEDVRVLGFGAFVLFLLPAAFVDLPTDQLMALSPWQQLRVFAAGVWHNIVLVRPLHFFAFSEFICIGRFFPIYQHNFSFLSRPPWPIWSCSLPPPWLPTCTARERASQWCPSERTPPSAALPV